MSEPSSRASEPPLALTMGEPAGIGGEIALKAWLRPDRPAFFVLDDAERLRALAAALALPVPIAAIGDAAEALAVFPTALPVLHRPLPAPVTPGVPALATAQAVLDAIADAVRLVQRGEAAAVVTNPIHKKILYAAGFAFPGHTEYLADLAGTTTAPVMMLASPMLRVVPVTIHVPLRHAIESLTPEAIVHAARVTHAALRRDFGIARPRLAVAGLNPHAGEEGTIGWEDETIVAPAVAELRAAGLDARGPVPADTLFSARSRATYDAAVCLYHDQALIPLKALDFDGGVNVTLGLPFVRASPDHGTALDIAGRGVASADSLIAALTLAAALARRRRAGAAP